MAAALRTILDAKERWSLASRVLAAAGGGYALTALTTLAASLALTWIGVGKAEAVLTSTMISFLLYAAIVMAVFHARTASRAWIGLILAAVPCVPIIGVAQLTGGF